MEVRIASATHAQVVSDFYCGVSISVYVRCWLDSCDGEVTITIPVAHRGDAIPWVGLPEGWNVVNRMPYCPRHTIETKTE